MKVMTLPYYNETIIKSKVLSSSNVLCPKIDQSEKSSSYWYWCLMSLNIAQMISDIVTD